MSIVDFNRYRQPFLEVPLFDDNKTVLRVTLPTVDLQEELRVSAQDFNALLDGGNAEKRAAIYDLAARLMSCNRNFVKITPEELRTTYRLDEEDLVVFFKYYTDFITNIEHAKN